jgi:HEAT repeat protein
MLWHMLYDSLGPVTNPAAQSLVMEVLQKNKEASVQDPLLASLENIADANAIDVLVPLFKGSDKMLVYDAYKVLAKICGRPMYNAEIFWKDRQKITGDIDQAIQREKKARQEGQNDLKTRHCCPK